VQLHGLGIAAPGDDEVVPGKWNGHLVVTVPSHKTLVDTTLYQAVRPAWAEALSPMMAVPLGDPGDALMYGLRPLAWAGMEDGDYEFHIAWLDRDKNASWKMIPEVGKNRRAQPVKDLVKAFGSWRGK
jgi:hypothetical protein